MNNLMLYEEFNLFKPKLLDQAIIDLTEDIKKNFNIENLHTNIRVDGMNIVNTMEYVHKGQNIKIIRILNIDFSSIGIYINNEKIDVKEKYIRRLQEFLSEENQKIKNKNKLDKINKLINSSEEELTNKSNDPYNEENWLE